MKKIKYEDLIYNKKEGRYFLKKTNTPFTGEITGDYRGRYVNGLEEGPWEYYDFGVLEYKCEWKKGIKHGYHFSYYESGALEEKSNYKNDYLDGLHESYYENGNLIEKGRYRKSLKEGIWESYHKNGKLEEKGKFKRGFEDGL